MILILFCLLMTIFAQSTIPTTESSGTTAVPSTTETVVMSTTTLPTTTPETTATTSETTMTTSKSTAVCFDELTCNDHGFCRQSMQNTKRECHCDDCWTTDQETGQECGYKKTSQVLTFLMSLFFGNFGTGYFLTGYNGLGVLILFSWIAAIVLSVVLASSQNGFVAVGVVLLWLLYLCLWWTQLIKFALSDATDFDGYELCYW